jgi:serine/threonine protein kinase
VIEITTMKQMKHPSLLKFKCARTGPSYQIVTRFCPGRSLYTRLHKKVAPLTASDLKRIAYQVATGMEYLHRQDVVHRDLKTLNILLDKYNNAYIADFGLCSKGSSLRGVVGTPNYTAPEVLGGKLTYGPKVDVYSYGIVLWEMRSRKVPFAEFTPDQIWDHVWSRNWRLMLPAKCSAGLQKLITTCWSQNPSDRPTFADIVRQFEENKISFEDEVNTGPGLKTVAQKSVVFDRLVQHCPPLNHQYVQRVLRDPRDPNFDSIAHYLYFHWDDDLKEPLNLRAEDLRPAAESHLASVLLLVSRLASDREGESFRELALKSLRDGSNPHVDAALVFMRRFPKHVEEDTVVRILDHCETGKETARHGLVLLSLEPIFRENGLAGLHSKLAHYLLSIKTGHLNFPLPTTVQKAERRESKLHHQEVYDAFQALVMRCQRSFTDPVKDLFTNFMNFIGETTFEASPEFIDYVVTLGLDTPDEKSIGQLLRRMLGASKRVNLASSFERIIGNDVFERGCRSLGALNDCVRMISEALSSSYPKLALTIFYQLLKPDRPERTDVSLDRRPSGSDVIVQTRTPSLPERSALIAGSVSAGGLTIPPRPLTPDLGTPPASPTFQSQGPARFKPAAISRTPSGTPAILPKGFTRAGETARLMDLLVGMKTFRLERLYILSTLMCSEQFCKDTARTTLDQMGHLLTGAIRSDDQRLLNAGLKLLLALCSHRFGCQAFIENAVFDLFVQHFVSSSSSACGQSNVYYVILTEAMNHMPDVEVRQLSLVLTCLSQSFLYEIAPKDKVLEALVAVAKRKDVKGVVQAHDLRPYVIRLKRREPLAQMALYLEFIATVNKQALSELVEDILSGVHTVLGGSTPTYHHPSILGPIIGILEKLLKHPNPPVHDACKRALTFINQPQLVGFCQKLSDAFLAADPNNSDEAKTFKDKVNKFQQKVTSHPDQTCSSSPGGSPP